MSTVSFRRGGLFDPMILGSDQQIINNVGLFANSLGKPTFDVESPDAWKAQAARLQSLGDSQGAIQALSMGQRLEAQRQAKMDALQPIQSDARANARNIMEGAKAKAKDAADIEKLAKMAESRFGSDTAELVRMLPKDQAIQLIRNSAQNPKRELKEIKEVDEQGNTVTRIIDLNNNNQDVVEPFVSKRAQTPEEAQNTEAAKAQQKDLLDLTRKIASNQNELEWFSGFTGSGVNPVSWANSVTPATQAFLADLDRLQNSLTLENTKLMSGVLSESDIKLLASAASGIRKGANIEHNMGELRRIYEKLGGNPEDLGYMPEDTSAPGRVVDFNDLP